MPGQHAVLSPSASGRWLQCPASVRMAEKVPQGSESKYAHEGTLAHALAEIEANHHFGHTSAAARDREYEAWRASCNLTIDQIGEMQAHVKDYVALIEERLARHPGSIVLFEERMDSGVEACWGTSDTVIVGPSHIEIIDLKYGMGVRVAAGNNSQLRLYGLGALDTFGDLIGEATTVYVTVFQPRLGHVDTEEISADELRAWREAIKPIADQALHDPNAPFGPSESACRFCPAAGDCAPRMEKMIADDFMPVTDDPEIISDEDLGRLLGRVDEMMGFCEAVKATAMRRAYTEGSEIPGWKVVRGRGRRFFTDPEEVVKTLTAEGYSRDQIVDEKVSVKGITAIEKLVGKSVFPVVLEGLVQKTEGNPALVPLDDKRPPIDRHTAAAEDFGPA